ncbi:type I polyketide synthase [Actinoplanes sp. NPDC026619]|uniref:type I polyketide synthase n=1 Tax=Actinoplanes sp. NPDC026619 TaxID=3155798 RepID=UPI0033D37146
MATTEPIAIIGLAARLPQSDDIDQYWQNLVAGRDCLTELSDAELLRHHEDPANLRRPDYIRRRPVIDGADALDIDVFGLTPREAELRDPQYRLMLEIVHATLEHSGYDSTRYPGSIGLFAATNANRYRYDFVESHTDVVRQVGWQAIDISNHPDYMCTFVSYKLGLRGPSATVLTACSSSLTAVHMACISLRAGDCEMAVAGGVDIEFPYHQGYIPLPGGFNASDGVVRAFDGKATGTNFGDGVGAVMLKPLAAARRDNDTIYAVILGSAVNNDGSRKVGFTAPSVAGQSECAQRALRASGVDPRDIGYVEAHGTGTRVGDPIELTGLIDAYQATSDGPLPHQYCGIGSVKSNVGHLGQAAGVASLIKATLILRHDLIPPTINVTTPHPDVDWENSPFFLTDEPQPWPRNPDRPRHIGVSSFGVGGTNVHVILGDAPPPAAPAGRRPHEALLWSAMDLTAEAALRERLAGHFDRLPDDAFGDTAFTMRSGRAARPVRAALVATGAADAAAGLRTTDRVLVSDGTRRVVFAFPGQGAQFPGMCRELYDNEPLFRDGCDAAFELLEPLLGQDLAKLWRTTTEPADLARTELARTEVAQPLLYVLEYTLAHCLMAWGVTPSQVVGHSLGELVAGAVAGVFDFESGLRAVAERALWMARMPTGAMLAVSGTADDVGDVLSGTVVLASVNGPRQVVLAGPAGDIAEAAAVLTARGLRTRTLDTSHAYHSPSMADAAERFEAALGGLVLHPPAVPIVSAATGRVMTDDEATSPAFWAGQLISPVRFGAAAEVVLSAGASSVVEIGPGRTLSTLLRARPGFAAGGHRVLATAGNADEPAALTRALARLWVDGVAVTYWDDDERRGYRRVALPGYPYQRRSFWLDPLPRGADIEASLPIPAAVAGEDGPAAPAVATAAGAAAHRWRIAELTWVRDDAGRAAPEAAGGGVILLPAAAEQARGVQNLLQRTGLRGQRVVDGRDAPAAGRAAIDPTDAGAWSARLDQAAEAGTGPVTVIHAALAHAGAAAGVAPGERLTDTIATVVAALRAASVFQRRTGRPTRLVLLGSHLVDVSGGDRVDPHGAALAALMRTAAQEVPAVSCQVVDLGERAAPEALLGALARPDLPVQAVRGAARWIPRLAPVHREVAEGPPPRLRHRGTYLVTGGLGGIGLVVARALAETGLQPRLALLARTAPAERPDGDAIAAALDGLAEAGAEVEVVTADVADLDSLRAAVHDVEQRLGQVGGVVHAAGVAGGGLLERRSTDQVRAVLRPKVDGLHALEAVFAGRSLDFLAVFSSVAAVSGMYGSGDYAAANAYLDAYCAGSTGGPRRTVSMQWPGWAEVGMLARSAAGQAILNTAAAGDSGTAIAVNEAPGGAGTALELFREAGRDWEFDEHVFEGTPVLPGTSMLEIVAIAGRRAAEREDWPVAIRDLVFLAPVVGDRRRQVRAVTRPLRHGHKVIVQSRGAGTEEPWTDHATATVAAAAEPAEQPVFPRPEDGPMAEPTDAPLAGWVAFGPRWATMTEVRGHDLERTARLILPERYHDDFTEHPVHPAIVDVAAGLLHDLEDGQSYAPFIYRRVTVHAPMTGDVRVHARFSGQSRTARRAVDFDIFDTATGRLLLRAESFAMREVADRRFGATAGGAAREKGPALPPARTEPEVRPGLLRPEEGAAAFLRLLSDGDPAVALVYLADAPLHIPGLPWPDAVAPAAPTVAAALPVPSPVLTPTPTPASAPAAVDDVVAVLQKLWTASLGVTDLGPDDDFFEVGGNSLAAVQLTAQINAHFGTDLGAGTLFDHPTLRALATEVPALRARPTGSATS